MSAPVKKCEVCDSTGSKSREIGGDLDCVACNAADERVAMRNKLGPMMWAEEVYAWRAYQLGKAAASVSPESDRAGFEKHIADGHPSGCLERHPKLHHLYALSWVNEAWLAWRKAISGAYPRDTCSCAHIGECDGSCAPYIYGNPANVAAAPVVPVAAQPVVAGPHDERDSFITAYRLWQAKEAPNAHPEMVHYMSESHWKRAAGAMWRARAALAAPSLEAQPAGEVVRDAARLDFLDRCVMNHRCISAERDRDGTVGSPTYGDLPTVTIFTIPSQRKKGLGLRGAIDAAMAQGDKA